MRLVPPEVSRGVPSAAERQVHRILKTVELPGYTAFHSLGLAEHDYKRVGEIDFLIVGPEAILVLEVKGGGVSCRNGIWTFTDRFGQEHRRAEGPFAQASSAMFALKKRLDQELPARTLSRTGFGYACVFPDCDFHDQTSVEWAKQQLIDPSQCRTPDAMTAALKRLIRFVVDHPPHPRAMNADTLDRVMHVLRPDFDAVPSLRRRADLVDDATLRLTEDQFRYLDFVRTEDRVLCDGGAGTGKTFLAAEVARREAAAGHLVTVTCKSPILARFIAAQPGLDAGGITVVPFDGLADIAPTDVLVVDEAQDVVNVDDLAIVDGAVTGGISNGRWRIFLDRNHQAGVLGRFDPEALALLEHGDVTSAHLPENCRNTEQIIREVGLVLHADMGETRTGPGPEVLWRWWDDEPQAGSLLADELQKLLDDGVEPARITILCGADPRADSVLPHLPRRLRKLVEPLSHANVHRLPSNRIGAARLGLFKGLENSYICVTDIPSMFLETEDRGAAELYVAMTRARAGLWLGLPSSLRPRITELSERFDRRGP